MIERFLWLVVFLVCSAIASTTIYSLALSFQAAPTSIGIESINYQTSNLPFPSVTLCLNDRVDWNRVLELEPKIFPNDTNRASRETFQRILAKLSVISFGDFDQLEFLKHQDVRIVHDLSGINITQVLREVMPRCNDILFDCWWRNASRNCCEIFEVQKTEYGFCYSFNSEVAEPSGAAGPAESRPRKASGYGEWSGVRVTIHLGNITRPPNSEEVEGVMVLINTPYVWPNTGTMIPSGSLISIALDCVSGYATEKVLKLDNDRQPCKYDATGVYNQNTCLSLCKRSYVTEYCGCNPSFLFSATTSYRDCTIEDFACLSDYNDLFNDYIVHFGEKIFHDADVSSMICDCLPECDYQIYKPQFSNVPHGLHGTANQNDLMLDVHYMRQVSFRYKTDIIITPMTLLVSFGGIISLFLGGSVLSAVEIAYYLIVALYSSVRWRRRVKKTPRRRQQKNPAIVHATVLPILDYSSVKPRAEGRIPIFANYGLAKSNSNRY